MLKENRKTMILASILTLAPMAAGAVLWDSLPDMMATHFGLDNQPDGFTAKPFAVFGIPVLLLAVLWVCAYGTSRDPKKQNISGKMFRLVIWIIPVVSVLVSIVMYSYNLGNRFDVTLLGGIFTGLLFMIIGNYLPKARQSYTIGIRIPWTLADEDNWNRTHRLAGPLWMICGAALIAVSVMHLMTLRVLFGIITAAVLIPVIYSYWLARNK